MVRADYWYGHYTINVSSNISDKYESCLVAATQTRQLSTAIRQSQGWHHHLVRFPIPHYFQVSWRIWLTTTLLLLHRTLLIIFTNCALILERNSQFQLLQISVIFVQFWIFVDLFLANKTRFNLDNWSISLGVEAVEQRKMGALSRGSFLYFNFFIYFHFFFYFNSFLCFHFFLYLMPLFQPGMKRRFLFYFTKAYFVKGSSSRWTFRGELLGSSLFHLQEETFHWSLWPSSILMINDHDHPHDMGVSV